MSTRASVAKFNEDGTVTSVYVHSDGYKAHLGVMLRDHHNTERAVFELLQMGDASFIGPSLTDSVFYHRDKREPRNRTLARTYADVDDWRRHAYHAYMYLFDFRDSTWYVYQDGHRYQKV